jgi:hypothetical protein
MNNIMRINFVDGYIVISHTHTKTVECGIISQIIRLKIIANFAG